MPKNACKDVWQAYNQLSSSAIDWARGAIIKSETEAVSVVSLLGYYCCNTELGVLVATIEVRIAPLPALQRKHIDPRKAQHAHAHHLTSDQRSELFCCRFPPCSPLLRAPAPCSIQEVSGSSRCSAS